MDWSKVYGAQDDSLEGMLARGQVNDSAMMQVARELEQRKQADRSFGLQEENARENRAFRETQQKSLDDDRKERAIDRDESRKVAKTGRFLATLPLRKKGDLVTPEERVTFAQEGLNGSAVAAGADAHGEGPHFHFAGTAAQDDADARQAAGDAAQKERERHEREMERLAAITAGAAATKAAAASGTKPRAMLAGDARRIADFDTSLNELDVLGKQIGTTGPASQLATYLPNIGGLGADAKTRQALIDRVKQVIGKTLEGGVLRKEDEIKYEKILPTIGDLPEVATQKIAGLRSAIEQRKQTGLENYADAGYDTSKFAARQAAKDAQHATPVGATSAAPSAPAAAPVVKLIFDPATGTFKKAGG